ncbi:hypothetical protein [Dyadobacter sp. MSC1_007]|jgi:hypothetical protein|uniref:hypothetical protein n=1 Tax=Dyadobacter sp. MSC1_007 TaxID=2909264 RepID=UPI002030DDD9|nr:hypothetical protein [Dyadobacter sp. MSC1_007]
MKKPAFSSKTQKQRYLVTIKALRAKNFSNNLPFLILSDKLPEGQVYREYPDGRIELQQVFTVGPQYKTKVLTVLAGPDADRVREEYELL